MNQTYYEETFIYESSLVARYPIEVEVTVAYDLIKEGNQFHDDIFNHQILTVFTKYGEDLLTQYLKDREFRREVDRQCQLNHHRKGF